MDGGLRAAGEMFSCCWNTRNGHHKPINLVQGTPGAAQFPPGIVSYNQLAPVPAAHLEPRRARALADGRASSEPGQSTGGPADPAWARARAHFRRRDPADDTCLALKEPQR